MAKMMTGGMAPKKQGKIGEAIDRMRIGRKAKLEAKSEAAAGQGNAVKAKRLSNRAEKVGNRMELKAVKKGGVLPATKTMGDYVGKTANSALSGYLGGIVGESSREAAKKMMSNNTNGEMERFRDSEMKRLKDEFNFKRD